jgi:hypothetical protein
MQLDAPEKMFTRAVEAVKARLDQLHVGWTYRAEYLQKPHHNALAYDRIPKDHLIIFDINTDEERYLGPGEKKLEAERLGLECVPGLFYGRMSSIEEFRALLETTSVLGGQKIEGVVVKPIAYDLFGRDHKVLMGKFVSEAFKEVHKSSWRQSNLTNGDILQILAAKYTTPARWQKAVQHLRERGLLEDSLRDIEALFKEVPADVEKEATDEIKEALFGWAWPHVRRAVTHGLPEWWKEQLLNRQFGKETEHAIQGSREATTKCASSETKTA